jgi:hypothetical protein
MQTKPIRMIVVGAAMAATSTAWAQGTEPAGEVRATVEPVVVVGARGLGQARGMPAATLYKTGLRAEMGPPAEHVLATNLEPGGATAIAYKTGLMERIHGSLVHVTILLATPGARLGFLPSKPWQAL